MMARYRERFSLQLESIEARGQSARRRLEEFTDLFRLTLRQGNRLCLCGMLATEYATLPPEMQREVRRFYEETEVWLARILEEGRDANTLMFEGPPKPIAHAFFATLEGAMIAARAFDDESRLARAAEWFLFSLEASKSKISVSGRPRPVRNPRVRKAPHALTNSPRVLKRRRS
jgi:TetR/AcrR family transcriptional repressor of nem operon